MSEPNLARAGPAAAALTRMLRGRPRPSEARAIADPSRVRRILVVKVHDQLGDFVLATPALRALRERYPTARIALATREFLAPLARRVPFVHQVLVLPRARDPRAIGAWFTAAAALTSFQPEMTFVLNSVSRSKTADTLAALSRAKLVVGRSRVGAGPLPSDLAPDPLGAATGSSTPDPVYDLDLPFARGSEHEVQRTLDLVRWCAPSSSTSPELRLSDAERAEAWRAIEESFGKASVPSPRVGFHPGAANPLKCWPLESFIGLGIELMRQGSTETGALMVFDSPRERGRGAALCAGLAARGTRSILLPPGGIEWFAALCSHLDLLVCNDSGVAHVAAALGVSTLSFHSLGRPREWAPVSSRAIALGDRSDIAAISVGAAVAAARGLLALSAAG